MNNSRIMHLSNWLHFIVECLYLIIRGYYASMNCLQVYPAYPISTFWYSSLLLLYIADIHAPTSNQEVYGSFGPIFWNALSADFLFYYRMKLVDGETFMCNVFWMNSTQLLIWWTHNIYHYPLNWFNFRSRRGWLKREMYFVDIHLCWLVPEPVYWHRSHGISEV